MAGICRFWGTLFSFSLLYIPTMSAVAIKISPSLVWEQCKWFLWCFIHHHGELEWFLLVIAWAGDKSVETTNFGSIYGVVGSVIFTLFSRSWSTVQFWFSWWAPWTQSLSGLLTKNSSLVPAYGKHCTSLPSGSGSVFGGSCVSSFFRVRSRGSERWRWGGAGWRGRRRWSGAGSTPAWTPRSPTTARAAAGPAPRRTWTPACPLCWSLDF